MCTCGEINDKNNNKIQGLPNVCTKDLNVSIEKVKTMPHAAITIISFNRSETNVDVLFSLK